MQRDAINAWNFSSHFHIYFLSKKKKKDTMSLMSLAANISMQHRLTEMVSETFFFT